MDKFKTSLSKATRNKDCDPPKPKHLAALLYAIDGNSNLQLDRTFPLLVQKLRDNSTMVRFKAAMALYFIIRKTERKNVFDNTADLNLQLNFFHDDNYPRGHCCSIIPPLFNFIKLKAKGMQKYEEIVKN